jgi:hypothetical protein
MPYGKGTYGSKVGRPKKKMSTGQKKIARAAGNPRKIEAADFKKLRRKK